MNHQYQNWIATKRITSPNSPCTSSEYEIIIGRRPCDGRDQQAQTDGQICLHVLKLDLKQTPILHPPIDGEMRSMINYLRDAFPCIMEWSYEQWDEYIRRQPDPEFEVDHWLAIDRAFTSHAGGKPLDYQMEVFRLLILHCIPSANLDAADFWDVRLKDDEVNSILDDYYAHYVEG